MSYGLHKIVRYTSKHDKGASFPKVLVSLILHVIHLLSVSAEIRSMREKKTTILYNILAPCMESTTTTTTNTIFNDNDDKRNKNKK